MGGVYINLFPRYWIGVVIGTVVGAAAMSYWGYSAGAGYFVGMVAGWVARSVETRS